MAYAIFDNAANLVESFDDREEARAALDQIAGHDPDAVDDYAVFGFDSSGQPVGRALTVSELGADAVSRDSRGTSTSG